MACAAHRSRLQPGGPQAAGLGGTQEQTDRQTAAEWEVERPPGDPALVPVLSEGPSRFQVRNRGGGSARPSHQGGQGSWYREPGLPTSRSRSLWCCGPRAVEARPLPAMPGALVGSFCHPRVCPVLGKPMAPGLASGSLGGPEHALQNTHEGAGISPACEPPLPPRDWAYLVAGNL